MLPPQLPGYRRYCPYPHDLARARRLVAQSGTRGQRVTLWQGPEPELRPIDDVVLRTLRRLGYRTRKKVLPSSTISRITGNSDYRVQISGGGGWYADYPAASDFLALKFSCASFIPGTDRQDNAGGFCDPALDREMDRALAEQITAPARADRRWAHVDRVVTDRAAWVPTINPLLTDFVSARVGNYQYHPLWGMLADQLWVR